MSVRSVPSKELPQKEKVILVIGNILIGDLQEYQLQYILIKVIP
jgi:hypothetical protein